MEALLDCTWEADAVSDNDGTKAYRRQLTPIERLFSRSPFSIVTMAARIRGSVGEGMVREALDKVRWRHPNLRVRVTEDERGAAWLTTDGAGDIPVTTVPRESDDHWIRVVQENSRLPFEFARQPAIRFILVQSAAVSELVILCHHILCDGLSLAYLARDLMIQLGDPAREVEVLPDPVPMGRDSMPQEVSASPLVRLVVGRMNKRWQAEKVVFDQEDYICLNSAYWTRYGHQALSVELSEAQTSGLVERCRSHGVTVNSALTAAFVGAQVTIQGEKPFHSSIFVASSLRDRLPTPPGEAMGFYAGSVRPKLHYDTQRDFWDNASRFQRDMGRLFNNQNLFGDPLLWCYLDPTILEAINFKRLGGLVSASASRHEKLAGFSRRQDVVQSILRRDKMDSLDRITTGTAITNLGRLDFPRAYGALELDRLIMNPGAGFPLVNFNLVLGAVTCAGKLSLLIEFVEDNVDVEAMAEIKGRALQYLALGSEP